MGIIERDLSYRPEEGNRGFARGIHGAGEEVSQCLAAHGSGMEGIEQGVTAGEIALDGEGTAGHDGGHNGFPAGMKGSQQPTLGAHEVEVGQAMCLTGQDSLLPYKGQDDFGRTGCGG